MSRLSKAHTAGDYRTAAYRKARARLLADHPQCVHNGPTCIGTATEADHQPPIKLHDHLGEGKGCCELVPSCGPCARRQGGMLARGGAGLLPTQPPRRLTEPPPVELAAFDVPWLADLLDVPADATWPRLMTAPHPSAVGSYGRLVEAHSLAFRGRPFRWWQQLYVRRLLEHDDAGRLVWGVAILTLARQLGKTWLVGDLCSWRLHAGPLFGAQQLVLSTGKDLAIVKEMQRPHLAAAKRDEGRYHPRLVNGQEEIELLEDGSRWLLRAKDAAYGLTCSLATVDEAWKVPASVVDDGIEPTTVEASDAQVLLVSTAHRRATALMIGRRARALQHLDDGDGPLLIEWSAAPDAELDDVAAWRQASPQWTEARERLMRERLEGALSGESQDEDEPDPITSFRTQWLNQWPAKRLKPGRGELLVELDVWASCAGEVVDDVERLHVALEDHGGLGCAVAAVAVQPDGRYGLDGWLCDSWATAMRDVRQLVAGHEIVKVYAGASLKVRLPTSLRGVQLMTSAVTRTTLPTMRQLVLAGEVVHDSVELDEQLEGVRVVEAVGGLQVVPGLRSDLLRAASWALASAARPRRSPAVR